MMHGPINIGYLGVCLKEVRIQQNPNKNHSSCQDLNVGLRSQQMFDIGTGASDKYRYGRISIESADTA